MRLKKTFFGAHCLKNALSRVIEFYGPRRIFLITGKQSYQNSPAKKIIDIYFANSHLITHFDDFDKNPKIEDVFKGVEYFRQSEAKLIIAIGGGSVLDIAKMVNLFAKTENNLHDYLAQKGGITTFGVPLIAIPTTAGTGSEATHFSVLYVNQEKFSVTHPFMKPQAVIIDPVLSFHQPATLAATCAFDTLTQAIESYWAVNATPKSQRYAKKAIQLCNLSLINAVKYKSETDCARMSLAAFYAGKAIDISKTTAPHAFSYALTMQYGISHGHAVALTMPLFMKINTYFEHKKINDKRGKPYLNKTMQSLLQLLGCNTGQECAHQFKQLITQAGLTNNLKAMGIQADALPYLVDAVNVERLNNNPVKIDKNELLQRLQEEFEPNYA